MDTSALLDGWSRRYPPAHFPKLWLRIDDLIQDGRFLVSDEVIEEVKEHDDGLKAWIIERRDKIAVPTDEAVTVSVRDVLKSHSRLVMSGSGRNRADPFVIAVARLRGASVVTGEKGGTAERPKIPYVCSDLQIPCLEFLDLIKGEGWVFA